MYCVRRSSGRQTSAAPCCAASRIRATAFARFASGSPLKPICTRPTLNFDGSPFAPPEVIWMKNRPSSPPVLSQNDLLADQTMARLATSSVSRGIDNRPRAPRFPVTLVRRLGLERRGDCGHDRGGNESRPHHTLGAGAG